MNKGSIHKKLTIALGCLFLLSCENKSCIQKHLDYGKDIKKFESCLKHNSVNETINFQTIIYYAMSRFNENFELWLKNKNIDKTTVENLDNLKQQFNDEHKDFLWSKEKIGDIVSLLFNHNADIEKPSFSADQCPNRIQLEYYRNNAIFSFYVDLNNEKMYCNYRDILNVVGFAYPSFDKGKYPLDEIQDVSLLKKIIQLQVKNHNDGTSCSSYSCSNLLESINKNSEAFSRRSLEVNNYFIKNGAPLYFVSLYGRAGINYLKKYPETELNNRSMIGIPIFLWSALSVKDLDMVKYLISKGVNPLSRDVYGNTALIHFLNGLHIDGSMEISKSVIDFIMKNKFDEAFEDLKREALIYPQKIGTLPITFANKSQNIISLLLENKKDFQLAIKQLMDLLPQKEFDEQFIMNFVKILLDAGVDINSKNIEEISAIDVAIQQKAFNVVLMLLENGAIVDTKNIKEILSVNPPFYADDSVIDKQIQIIQKMLKQIDVNDVVNTIEDKEVIIPASIVDYAAEVSPPKVVKFLIDNGAEISSRFFKNASENLRKEEFYWNLYDKNMSKKENSKKIKDRQYKFDQLLDLRE